MGSINGNFTANYNASLTLINATALSSIRIKNQTNSAPHTIDTPGATRQNNVTAHPRLGTEFSNLTPRLSNSTTSNSVYHSVGRRGGSGKTQSRQAQRKALEQNQPQTASNSTKAATSTPIANETTEVLPSNPSRDTSMPKRQSRLSQQRSMDKGKSDSANSTKNTTGFSTPAPKPTRNTYRKPFTAKPAGSGHKFDVDIGFNTTRNETDTPSQPPSHRLAKRALGATRTHDGKDTKLQVPQAVTLYSNGTEYCSGTIIGDGMVLTAAHCVANKAPGQIQVGLGDTVKAEQIKVDVSNFTIHPSYIHRSLNQVKPEEIEEFLAFYEGEEFDDEYDDLDDFSVDPIINTDKNGREMSQLSLYDTAILKLEDGAMEKAVQKGMNLAYVKISHSHIVRVLSKIKGICENENLTEQQKLKQLSRERFWIVGSGKTSKLGHENATIENVQSKNDYDYIPDTMLSGYLRLKPDCTSLQNTLHFEFNVTSDMNQFITWCSGDSGGGIYHQGRRGEKAQLVGTVRGSNILSGACVSSYYLRNDLPNSEDREKYNHGVLEATPLDKIVRGFINAQGVREHKIVTKEWNEKIPSKIQYKKPQFKNNE